MEPQLTPTPGCANNNKKDPAEVELTKERLQY